MKISRLNTLIASTLICSTPGIGKAEGVLLCPIETATVTPETNADRIVCGNETDLIRCADRAEKFRKERDLAIHAADQNHNNWQHCRADLTRVSSLSSVEADRTQAMRQLASTPPTPVESSDSLSYFLAGAGLGAVVGTLATLAAILLTK